MEFKWLTTLIFILTFVSCIGALVSIYHTYIARKHSRAVIAYQFFLRYSTEEMRHALTVMGDFKKICGGDKDDEKKDFEIKRWFISLSKNEQEALEIEKARRIIKFYYRDVATLYQTNCIEYNVAEKICSAGGIYLFIDFILPMENKVNNFQYLNEYHPIIKIAKKMRRGENKNK